ncbi:carbonic anhydrase [Streptomyces sp. Tu 2975]|uniref:carbonic anhydrase n=1 Tax=Streptomyces sp. Tu 2975 TaxID=2676871 RepID=UPI001356C277|nr:carbonic anhydrase [Streptomyces sp. Tu 2975]QIP83734.1 carbonic anhydrase [Streptomyces sp. Tu 2975]
MQALLDHARSFHRNPGRDADTLRALAAGQSPDAMVISCSDSRVVPALITGAGPGEMFELRNAGNIVPPPGSGAPSGEAATIEYALEVLGVRDVVVCGHSHCGAMDALASGSDLSGLPGVEAWLSLVRPALTPYLTPYLGTRPGKDARLERIVQRNIVHQLAVLGSYPMARRLMNAGELRLHGWYYRVETGALLELGDDGTFEAR